MPQKYSFRQRVSYWFDNYMARGPAALIGGLAVVSLVVIFLAAAIIRLGGTALSPADSETPMEFVEAAWEGLMRTLDAGTMGGDQGWGFRFVMFFVTLGGVFVVSALIGILTNGVDDKLAQLRKGRSLVLESDHTVILGWSPQVFTVISELAEANSNRKSGAVVVVMAEEDKVAMEDAIRERVPDTKGTRVICRSGNPMDLNDIELVSPRTARSIIILPGGEDPDSLVIKSALALTNNPNRRAEPYHIVTQIRDPRNMDVIRMIGQRDRVQPILVNDLIARVVAQTSRQSGLSIVYTELLNFGGDEIYFKEDPALVGKTYGDALLAYEDSAVVGIFRAGGDVRMNPPMDTVFGAGDSVAAISRDDDTIRLTDAPAAVDESAVKSGAGRREAAAEKCLILGWNRCGAAIVHELDAYVAKGSLVKVVSETPGLAAQIRRQTGGLKNQKLEAEEGNIADRALLESLKARDYDHIIVLADNDLSEQEADARTLVTLLHLRDMADKDRTPFSIVSEMLDLRNRELAEAAQVDDFIVSEHLVSLMMTQLSENPNLYSIFANILDPAGPEIYLKPVGDYVETGRPVNFATVAAAARARGETAIGYRILHENHDAGKSYGVHTNPKKSVPVNFAAEDKVIVIAED